MNPSKQVAEALSPVRIHRLYHHAGFCRKGDQRMMGSPAVLFRVVTHRDTLLLAEAADHGAVDVDRMLFDVERLEPPAVEPAHHLIIALQARALEETAEGALRGHATFPTEYLADDLVMTDRTAVC
jgi:hypothetical protein